MNRPKRNFKEPEPGKGHCPMCKGTGISADSDMCIEGFAAPYFESKENGIVRTVRGKFIKRCVSCKQFNSDLSAALYRYEVAKYYRCDCNKKHILINPETMRGLPEEIVQTYIVTVKVPVTIHPFSLLKNESHLKSVLLENLVDRIKIANFNPEDVHKIKFVEERKVG